MKTRLASLLTLLFLLISAFCGKTKAQTILDPQYISIAEGMSSGFTKNILQDSYGLMWIGTDYGLHQYDGYKFHIYKSVPGKPNSLQHNDVWGLAEDSSKNIWVANELGASRFDRVTNDFINYDFTEIFKAPENACRIFNLLVDSKDRLWGGTVGLGLVYYDPQNDTWKQAAYQTNDTTQSYSYGSVILGLTEDSKGRVWIGSGELGLMYIESDSILKKADIKFLDKEFDFSDDENRITYLYSDPTNVIWVTTRNGVHKYDPNSLEFKTIVQYDYKKLIIWNHWNGITQDYEGNIWIGNNFRGILRFDGISDEYEEIEFAGRTKNRDGSSDININHVMLDNTGILWFSSITQGMIKYDPRREPFMHYTSDETNENSISSSQIFTVVESKINDNQIYVGTRGGGLNLFDQMNQTFKEVKLNVKSDLFGGSVRSLAEEEDGSLWVGSWGDGLIYLNNDLKEIERYTTDSLSFNSLSDNSVRVIKKDIDGNYWIGTNQGLNYLNPSTQKIRRIGNKRTRVYPQELFGLVYDLSSKTSKSISISKVESNSDITKSFDVIKPRHYAVISTGEGFLGDEDLYDFGWIESTNGDTLWGSHDATGTFHAGGGLKNRVWIDVVELKPGSYKLRYLADDSHAFNDWNDEPPLNSENWGIKIVEINDQTDLAKIYDLLKSAKDQFVISGQNIRSIHISNNIVWIGTDAVGLDKLDKKTKTVKNYSYDENSKNCLSNNSVQYIHEDTDGALWLATNAGLNRFDPIKEEFKVYTEEDGLPTNYIASILPGDNGDLWIATRNGISKMVTDTETGKATFVNYDAEDGLGGTDFIALVALKASNGQYFFGGEHGLNVFTPKEANEIEPELIFSDLKISNRSVKTMPRDDNPLDNSLFELDEVTLPYDQNDLTFEFAALHFADPDKNQYAHKLEGYDKEWVYNNKREVTYTNLDPGEYAFSIKGSNRDGVWNSKGRSIAITINPPWWFTTFAYIGYGFIFIGIIFAVDRIQRRRMIIKAREKLRIQNAEHRAEAAELQAKATESERRALEAEFEQKKKELEEARQLQLSMLPKELPQLPNLDIAVYMKTATEVGGDYYDFHIGIDGTLTVVLGDATGHGMKAGTMVTTTKSLFNVLAPNPNIVETFHEMTRCLRLMQLEKLSMCMTMMKIVGDKIQMSAAGMPPVYIYKRESQSIEEHLIKGMPLGTFADFPYSLVESNLSSGDTILMMSDGFPELMNSNKEMFGYKNTRNLFEEVAGESPEDIISKLTSAGTDWVNEADPDDDVTFVVIKVK